MTVHIQIMDRDTNEVLEDFIAHDGPNSGNNETELAAEIKSLIQMHFDTDE